MDGIYVPEYKLPQGDTIVLLEGYEIKGESLKTWDITLNKYGISSVAENSRWVTSEDSYMSSHEDAVISPTNGLYTIICTSRYGQAQRSGDVMEVKRWTLSREAKLGCPLSKKQSRRGLEFGKKDERIQRFKYINGKLHLEDDFGSTSRVQRLIQIGI